MMTAIEEGAVAIGSDDFLGVFGQLGSAQRAVMILSLREAMAGLTESRNCDCCSACSKRIRFLAIYPGDDFRSVKHRAGNNALSCFVLLCDQCLEKGPNHWKTYVLDQCAAMYPNGAEAFYKPTVVGLKVGEAKNIPMRRAIQQCRDCQASIWVAQDWADRIQGETMFVCRDCAEKRLSDGRMQLVPMIG